MEFCKNLNYVRSLSAGKAFFYYLDDHETMKPLVIDQTRLRAPKGGYAEMFGGSHLAIKNVDAHALAFSNPQFIEECYVPFGTNRIYCAFSLRIHANSLKPDVCSNEEIRQTLQTLARVYQELNGYQELATRIAKNILMGTWLWRNRHCRNIAIKISTSDGQKINVENSFRLSWNESWDQKSKAALEQLSNFIANALINNKACYYIDVKASLDVGWGDEVFPSQEFVDEKKSGIPSKRLARGAFSNGQETAAFHSQKIGAALQLIDDWYNEDADVPLRVNEYGADRDYLLARRHPLFNNDFYSLLSKTEHWIEQMQENKEIPHEVHFIISVLMKGGLFNCAKEAK